MELKINKKDFIEILTKIQGITLSKTNMPILSNVFIKADENNLHIMATDLDIGFSGHYSTEIITPGTTTVPSKKLLEIVREFPKDVIHIKELENKWIQIIDESVEYNIVGMDPEEFPLLPDIKDINFLKVDAALLNNMIDKTIYSVLTGEGYVEMTGIYIEQEEEKEGKSFLRMVSTDGHRLSFIENDIEKSEPLVIEHGVIIPRKGILEAAKLLDTEGSVMIGVKDNKFILKKDDEMIVTRLIEGEFPNYKNVIPLDNKNSLIVNRDVFLKMLRRMSIFSSEKYRGVKFKINKDSINIINTNPELGESSEKATVKYNGESIEIGFNPKYFIETLSTMESEDIIIRFKDNKSSCLISGDADKNFLSVIMPMRV